MSIVYNRQTRRQFLVGAGKSLLMLPLLPSLLPADAYAQTAQASRRMMLFWFDHGNIEGLWPARNIATTPVGTSGAREVALRSLASARAISPVFSAPRYESLRLANQMTILRGFDTAIGYGPGHGNFTLACAQDRNSQGNFPTIDTIIERSPTIYPASTPASVRKVVRINNQGTTLFYNKVGNSIQAQPHYTDNVSTFYNEVFSGLTGGTVTPVDTTNALKSNILNRVHSSYQSFRANRRISSDDRARLEQHMSYISDLQASYAQATPPPMAANCTRPAAPSNTGDQATYNRIYLDLLAIAFKCNLTKFGVMAFECEGPGWIPGCNINGGFHNAIHGSAGNALQRQAFESWWTYFATQIADRFLAPLEEMEGNTGRSYLQNMVTGMLCAGGIHSLGNDGGHNGLDSQQILIGNMGGAMRSGSYISMPQGSGGANLPYNCFLITLLRLMGVPASEYAYATGNGQGIGYYGFGSAYNSMNGRFYQPISEVMA